MNEYTYELWVCWNNKFSGHPWRFDKMEVVEAPSGKCALAHANRKCKDLNEDDIEYQVRNLRKL